MSRIDFKYYRENYTEEDVLGSGTFGKIVKVRHRRSGKCFALKKILAENASQRSEAYSEIEILKLCRHPLVVEIFEYYEVKIRNRLVGDGFEIGIIMELGHYSLELLILSRVIDHSPEVILHFSLEFLRLFAWLESRNIVHRDIKPGNIVVFEEPFMCKLIDFGLCCKADQRPKGVAGSFHYASPKMKKNFEKKKHLIKTNSFKDDVYSFGLTLYELVTHNISKKEINDPYEDMKRNSQSEMLARLVDQMLIQDEDSRPTFVQLLENPEIKELLETLEQPPLWNDFHENRCCISFDMSAFPEIEEFKTEKKKEIFKYERMNIFKAEIRCIYSIYPYILCGCQDGQIRVLNIEEKESKIILEQVHSRYVSILKSDSDDNLWSTDGNNKLIIWNKKKLFDCLVNNRFKEVKLEEDTFKVLNCPKHKGGISALECINAHKYAVGYYSGHVFIKDDDRELEVKFHECPVTCLKIAKDRCYSAGMDGLIKSCHMSSMKPHPCIHSIEEPICVMELNEENMIEIITLEGSNGIISENSQHTFRSKYPIDILMAYSLLNGQYIVLSDCGTVFKGKEIICEAEQNGWNCICILKENEIAIGSFEGEIIIISWEEKK